MGIQTIPFRKMNGLGNDFIIIDRRKNYYIIDEDFVRVVANRQSGIGCDQLITIEKSDVADIEMRIWNNDGGEVQSCGNAARCIGAILFSEERKEYKISTLGGLIKVIPGEIKSIVSVDMGKPKFNWQDIPLAEEFHDASKIELHVGPYDNPILYNPSVVNVGNPHCIFWVDDLELYNLAEGGPMLERHLLFPEGANISLAKIIDDENIKIKVWERGAGLTRACGTAACAVAVAASRKGLSKRSVNIELPGGVLHILWDERSDHIIMSGGYTYDYESFIEVEV